MKPLQRVFTKQATPLLESMISLESWYVVIKPNNTHIRNCHIYPVEMVIHDFGLKIRNLCRECSRNRQLHFGRAWWRWSRVISSLNQITLIFGIVTFILYKSVLHDFGPKFMKPLQSVFSKQATPLWASIVSLVSWYFLIKANNTHVWNCHIYPIQKRDSRFWSEIYESFAESVLETGNSTLGEHSAVSVVLFSQETK